ncbi:MAG: zinc transporter ZupT, partial [Candidatus Marinimicrobia bacterium]|nr:zinc transporter ZupT [Candidatus Neomarinimicrobiota bacterium]
MGNENFLFAFLLTLFAGLSTGIGSALAFFTKKTSPKFLSTSLGFSAGVMIYVSFVEIIPKARDSMIEGMSYKAGHWWTVVAFFTGILVIGLIDRIVPSYENPHEVKNLDAIDKSPEELEKENLMRMGLFSALAIAIHNFPEGLATFTSAIKDPTLGIPIAVAIAIHNIPEGIAVSVPIYFATKSRKKAFGYSFLSGISEPLGAVLGFIILRPFMGPGV